MKKTLFDKVWDAHIVDTIENGPQILYIDKHLIHEVTSPQAFSELENRNIPIFRPKQIVATADHNTPTQNQHLPVSDELSRHQLQELGKNCKKVHQSNLAFTSSRTVLTSKSFKFFTEIALKLKFSILTFFADVWLPNKTNPFLNEG